MKKHVFIHENILLQEFSNTTSSSNNEEECIFHQPDYRRYKKHNYILK